MIELYFNGRLYAAWPETRRVDVMRERKGNAYWYRLTNEGPTLRRVLELATIALGEA